MSLIIDRVKIMPSSIFYKCYIHTAQQVPDNDPKYKKEPAAGAEKFWPFFSIVQKTHFLFFLHVNQPFLLILDDLKSSRKVLSKNDTFTRISGSSVTCPISNRQFFIFQKKFKNIFQLVVTERVVHSHICEGHSSRSSPMFREDHMWLIFDIWAVFGQPIF